MSPMTWPRLATAFFTATVVAAATLGLAGCERRTTTDTATGGTTSSPATTDTAPAGAMPPASAASQ
ncbi:hypothetical protein [Ideonella sp.]|uniref:hypothetical protein n=1 Tax=Ideonella sp. TaxID=1929293 RepID=UPI002B4A5813|nr:hypothetical protein [Ideonella sp.]HJV71341.1 hypothetical protein [Ideonella sp.]